MKTACIVKKCEYLSAVLTYLLHWQPPRQSLDGYKHVVDVEYCPPVPSDGPKFSPKAVQAKEAAQNAPNTQSTVEYHEIVEGDNFFPKITEDISIIFSY